jgi:hypothetical protein
MTVRAARNVVEGVLNNSGIIDATSATSIGGVIVLGAGDGSAMIGGTVDASGRDGGNVEISSESRVYLTGSISADGSNEGGDVAISGYNILSAGAISADGDSGSGGEIALSAQNRLIATTKSELSADGASGGDIALEGQDSGIFSSGETSATGTAGGGGTISIQGPDLVLVDASMEASGATGGGTIEIGYSGDPRTPDISAETVRASPTTELRADARQSGDGGSVALWSNEETSFYGSLSATGGAISGDGGFLETSSYGEVVFGGAADASAANGAAGLFLLDPKNIIVDDLTGIFAQYELIDPNPDAGNLFGDDGGLLSTGNLVVASPFDDFGAVDAGAVYLFNLETGALISSLTGSSPNDNIGSSDFEDSFTILGNGNYVVSSIFWDNGPETDAGAVTFGSGITGVTGVVSAANSLVGTTANDFVGGNGVELLDNGNYVVNSPFWSSAAAADVGAVTFGDRSTGVVGAVGAGNSLVGSTAFDSVGSDGIYDLANGNYVVSSSGWDNVGRASVDAGAVTFASGTTGISGAVSDTNSLVGETAGDAVGQQGVTALPLANGNYVVRSPDWTNPAFGAAQAGAVTLGDGTTGISGAVSAINSLVGTSAQDRVGNEEITVLTNGNYVTGTTFWDDGSTVNVGAVTFGSGTTGVSGNVTDTNSLVGLTLNDNVGSSGVFALTNGNYVVSSSSWGDGATALLGAVTFGDGTTGVSGPISTVNSLKGTTFGDRVGNGVVALDNGNYVVSSPFWINGGAVSAGAVTFGDGASGTIGDVDTFNSLVGTTAGDAVGIGGITALKNGNYVVASPTWDSALQDVGAVTFGSGMNGIFGAVSIVNSLIGSTAFDSVGLNGITALANGNYVVSSVNWDGVAAANAGAATFGDGLIGISGAVSAANSLVGAGGSFVGSNGVTALSNGNYLVNSPSWDIGPLEGLGAVTFGNGTTGISGLVSAANSLVGSSPGDSVGNGDIVELTNGNYVVGSENWNNGAIMFAGAATLGDGNGGISGEISALNSLVGTSNFDSNNAEIFALADGNYVVSLPNWDSPANVDAGAVTFGDGNSNDGVIGTIDTANSITGVSAGENLEFGLEGDHEILAVPINSGRLVVGLTDPNELSFSRAQSQTMTIRTAFLTNTLNSGTDVALAANNDLTLSSNLIVNNPAGDGGNLSFAAGRSVLLNASITTDNGDLTIIANESLANGVIDSERDPGPANIIMAGGTSIDAGFGAVLLTLEDGFGKTNTTGGDISLQAITAGTIKVENLSSGSDVILNNQLVATDDGGVDLIVATLNGNFINNFGSTALSSPGARWLVYSRDPALDDRGGLVFDFKEYDKAYAEAPTPGDGNGFLYSIAPILGAELIGDVIKTYDGTATATLAAANYFVLGAIDGDTVVLNNPTNGFYETPDVGTSKGVAVAGVAIASASNGGATVFGYGFSDAPFILGNIGTINPATLTLIYTADAATRTYGAANPEFTGTVTGFAGTDTQANATTGTLVFTSPATPTSNVGTYAINGSGLSSINYNFVQALSNATALTINPATLIYTADAATRAVGVANPIFSGIVTGFVNGETQGAATTGVLLFSSPANAASVAGAYAINGSGLIANNVNYIFVQANSNVGALIIVAGQTPAQPVLPTQIQNIFTPTVVTSTIITELATAEPEPGEEEDGEQAVADNGQAPGAIPGGDDNAPPANVAALTDNAVFTDDPNDVQDPTANWIATSLDAAFNPQDAQPQILIPGLLQAEPDLADAAPDGGAPGPGDNSNWGNGWFWQ